MQHLQKTLPVGSIVIERYQVEALLGKGGFGAVYLVRDLRVHQNVFALKEMIDTDQRERRHFTLEAELLRRVDHPSLPRVYRAFDDPVSGRAYMLMDYIEGSNLERLRREQTDQRFSLSEVFSLLGPIVEALIYLHAQQPPIIHRDIKPSNIIVPVSGERPVLVDFGIAKEFDQDATTTAIRHASPGYGAPEQYSAGTNMYTDVYGLGATLYVLLTGTVPVDAFFRLTQHLGRHTDPLVPLRELVPALPEYVAAAIERALSLEHSERFASIEDFWQALRPDATDITPEIVPAPAASTVRYVPRSATSWTRFSRGERSGAPGRSSLRFGWLAILLFILLALSVGFASALFFLPGLHNQPARSSPVPVHKTATPVHTATPTHTATPRPTRTAAPTSVPASTLPALAPTYNGMVHDENGNIDTSMSLTDIVQQQGNVRGNFAVSPPLSGNGPFTGTVATNAFIQFTIHSTDPEVRAPLYFSGNIQKNGDISGTYCSLNTTTNRCDPSAGGYGSWSVQPGG